MKKIVSIFVLIIVIVLSTSCNSQSSGLAENTVTHLTDTTSNDTTILDLGTESTSNHYAEGTLPPPASNERYMLSDTLMLKITKNYLSTGNYEFEYGEEVPFVEIVNYYSFEGCFSFDERTFSEEAHKYYDEDTRVFSVPSNIVHDFLTKKFNTQPAPGKTEFYNAETDCYEFPRHLGTYNMDAKIISKTNRGGNVYDFSVDLTDSLDTTGKMGYYCSFTVELTEYGYKYHACKIDKKTVLTDNETTGVEELDTTAKNDETTGVDESNKITTLQQLKQARDNTDISQKGHYNTILAFITGDVEFLADMIDVEPSCLEGIETVKISCFEVSVSNTNPFTLDFSFTVDESDYPTFPVGEYNYYIDNAPVYWHSYDAITLAEEDEDLELIMNLMPSAVQTFDPTSSEPYDDIFSALAPYFIIETEYFFYEHKTTPEIMAERMEEFFGIKDFVPDEAYYKITDGMYGIKDEGRRLGIGTANRIVDVRKVSDTVIEVDVCFFADKATLCTTHKTTYSLEKGDFAYGYRLLKAETTKITDCEVLRFNS